MKKLIVEAPAKINLILNILHKRNDGYHELETIMHQINLIDIISIELSGKDITVATNSKLIPSGQENLAYKAAALFMEKNGIKAGVNIIIEKNIPVGAGLAGGSTDAAAVLSGLNRLFGLQLSLTTLQKMAAEIGSDVAFCLSSTTVLARGRGEKLNTVAKGPELNLVLVVPEFQVSTAEVYQNYKFDNKQQSPDIAAFIKAWQDCNIIEIASQLNNDLESVTTKKYHEINLIKDQLKEIGAINALMSGSGPSVFGIFPDQYKAEIAANVLQKTYRQVFLVTSYYRSD
ncbi:MAG: 4-(cytidine 5'-diphospho)-2-C-methyl-D-erythritol kinase [Syntrophomonadaceae bacterium]|jgi:4-diphosphocytidyl-2-C-methyl-D-erythritol kinase|nr:4-(cytidine 5'-diphospho)-2-C-methyl-D-erythritol kinase [Syntrophomonadaceae bacterium]